MKKKIIKKKKKATEVCIKIKDKDGNVINFDEEDQEEEEEEQKVEVKIEEQVEKEAKKKNKNRLEFLSVIQSLSNNMKKDVSEAIGNEFKIAIKSETATEKLEQVQAKKKKTDYPMIEEMIGAELETVEEDTGKKKT